ncbi:hypothetical protein NP233_g1745 [Leucocoprinus birnbaumii]|uniref:Uncharacterized protein n=1 Tax=Leucocoprinus birnbaumii TaxID=56174 RepID=A0AAD5VZI8_9AGAR|nr:hypothetical protein NP233_g1745 [Leucocoprinus birnbaumii]
MSATVKLYVYDLSNGMARSLSRQLTGRQIDGIWHTSVVVFGKEIFYGQGINITGPGQSHHGQPLQVIDMGETGIDEETFQEYLDSMREHYTADKVGHKQFEAKSAGSLYNFNCNSFTSDVVGFLTGGSIPDFIKDLPSDFLSTPFGAALRPTIDAMFRRPVAGQAPAVPTQQVSDSQLGASLLQSVSEQAQVQPSASTSTSHPLGTSSITAPVHVVTNPASFNSFLKTHRAAAAFFTSQTCPPCRVIEPVFEQLAEQKGPHDGRQGVACAKIDIDVGLGQNLAAQWNIRSTPTFYFFLDGEKKAELKGANAAELKTQIDLLIYEAYPPHPHTRIDLPIIQKMSLSPILFSQAPAVETMVSKLMSSLENASWPASANPTPDQIKSTISSSFAPYLKARFSTSKSALNGTATSTPKISSTPATLNSWASATNVILAVLPADVLFPLIDMWRLSFLDPSTGSWASAPSTSPCGGPISAITSRALEVLQQSESSKGTRNFILTTLRLLCNTFSSAGLTRRIFTDATIRPTLTAVLVQSLLHEDTSVRTAASSMTFNVAAWLQSGRVEAIKSGKGIQGDAIGEDEEWELEFVSAIVEALNRETSNEEVVHRLTAALAFFLRLSPWYDDQLKPLLDVLQVRNTLESKLGQGDDHGWEGEGGVSKKEVRHLITEVAEKLSHTLPLTMYSELRPTQSSGAWALPNEIVLEIAQLASAHSQSDYRTWLLLSRDWYRAVRLVCLRNVPVHLFSTNAVETFLQLLETYPNIASFVHHLWITSSTKAELSIARACTNLITLACQSPILTSIASMPTFKHTSLRELTVMTIWSPWEHVMLAPHANQLCSQITHLRHFEGLPPDFPSNELTSLKHLSFASFIYRDFIAKHVSRLGDMKTLETIVATTSWQKGSLTSQELAKGLQGIDKRLRVVHCDRGFSELGAWVDRTRLGKCLWSVARPDDIVTVGPPKDKVDLPCPAPHN